ncbi:MAG TPA: hypothetical protein DEB24_08020 [Coriobacteriia bacterium]|nr:hypothetical protein [Coriobacteriia bacterium]
MKKLLGIVLAFVLCFAMAGCTDEKREVAIAAFDAVVLEVEAQNAELTEAIDTLQMVIESGDTPFDDAKLRDAETAVATARGSIREIPEMPSKTEAIESITADLKIPSTYKDQVNDLKERQIALENSIKQMKQVTNPSESFVVERLGGIETITGISAVTEDNDLNGNLNKQGGYTATVYFSDSQVVDEFGIMEGKTIFRFHGYSIE